MIIFLKWTSITLLVEAVIADGVCTYNCPDLFPPGHRNIGDGCWAIGGEASGAYITHLETSFVVPQKPDDVQGLRVINPALDNTVSTRLLLPPIRAHFDIRPNRKQ